MLVIAKIREALCWHQDESRRVNLLLDKSIGGAHSDEAPDLFHVFVAYDTPAAMESAQHAATRFVKKVGSARTDWSFNSFDDLRRTPLAEDAAQLAAAADMVIFATSESGDLPFPTKAWVERWLAKKGNADTALVALAGCYSRTEGESTPAQRYLETVAREAGMSFKEDRFELAVARAEAQMREMSARATQISALMENLLRLPPPPHWGINE